MNVQDRTGRQVRVLVFPCGAESATEIHQALRFAGHVELFGASSVDDHGRLRFERYIGELPRICHPDFDGQFFELIESLGIEMVFATHDSVLEYLAPRAIAAGFYLVNGDPQTTSVARRKSATYALFADQPWTPHFWHRTDAVRRWPVIVKPDQGQGGQGVALVNDATEATVVMARVEDPILMEYLPGCEVTVDCFTDRHGRLLWIGPRTRERIRAGISMRSRLLALKPEIESIAFAIKSRLRLRGPWFLQLKADSGGNWKLLEISCKLGAATVAQRARGVNLPLMAVEDFLERDPCVTLDARVEMVDRSIATRAELLCDYDTVYVELDETLLSGTAARPLVMAFLYQSILEGKKVRALTRRAADPSRTLGEARIGRELFDGIVHVPVGSSMADHVTAGSVLIAHDAVDRFEAARKRGIPAIDIDAVEFLLR
jgi:hypothetical protein